MDGLQLQVQLVAEKSGDNHVSTATLEHMAQRLEQGFQGLTARVDGLAAAGIGAGRAAAQQPGGLPAAMKLEKRKPYVVYSYLYLPVIGHCLRVQIFVAN